MDVYHGVSEIRYVQAITVREVLQPVNYNFPILYLLWLQMFLKDDNLWDAFNSSKI